DEVVLHGVAVAVEVDAVEEAAAGDEVAVPECRTADGVEASVEGIDTTVVVFFAELAGDVGAEEVARHGVAARVGQVDAKAREVSDDQAPHGRVAGGDLEAVLVAVKEAAVQDDLELSVVGGGGGVDRGPRLRVAVDGHRLADDRQGGRRP